MVGQTFRRWWNLVKPIVFNPHVMFQTEQWKSLGRENTEKPKIVLIQSNDGRLQQFRFVGSAEISGHLSLNGFLYYFA